MKKILLTLALLFLCIAGAISVRTIRFGSRQIHVSPVRKIELDTNSVSGRLSKAIQHKTVFTQGPSASSSEEFRRFHQFLQDSFPRLHRTLTREIVGEHSLLYTWNGGSNRQKPILLLAHMDVVPVDPASEGEWKHPAFSGSVVDGYVWGRGALDDKASVMAILEAVEELLKSGFRPDRTVYLAFGHDEEIGGQNGARKIADLLHSRKIELEYVLDEGGAILDGVLPGSASPAALIGIAEKGYASLELTVDTQGGHASLPPRETAIGILSRAIHKLETRQLRPRLSGTTRQMFEFIGPELPWTMKLVLANLWLFSGLVKRELAGSPLTNAMIRTTMTTTMFESGIRENVLPTTARAVVNIRLLPGDTIPGIMDHARSIINDSRVVIRQRDLVLEPSPVSDINAPSFHLLHRTIREIQTQAIVAPALLIAATDSRHYASLSKNLFRFLPLTLRAEDLRRFHGIDERVLVKDYEQGIRFYAQLIRNSNE
jgi:carboxypeptidase PM20D1